MLHIDEFSFSLSPSFSLSLYNWSVNKFYKVPVIQIVENIRIGHEVSLRKISKCLALKALDFTPVIAQPQEMQGCGNTPLLSSTDVVHTQQVESRNL
jgi:hypothetical protein